MKKILGLLVIVAVAGLAWTLFMKKEVQGRYSLSELQDIAEGANEQLPVMVDEMTKFEKVTASDKTLEKHYKLVSLRKEDLDMGAFKVQMEKSIVSQSCNNQQSKNLFSSGVSEWSTYYDSDGDHLLTVKVSSGQCENMP